MEETYEELLYRWATDQGRDLANGYDLCMDEKWLRWELQKSGWCFTREQVEGMMEYNLDVVNTICEQLEQQAKGETE